MMEAAPPRTAYEERIISDFLRSERSEMERFARRQMVTRFLLTVAASAIGAGIGLPIGLAIFGWLLAF